MKKFIHFGWMRTGTTLIQRVIEGDEKINSTVKNRFFSYTPYFVKGKSWYEASYLNKSLGSKEVFIDSDENYSLGRFKYDLIDYRDKDFYVKKERTVIYHAIPEMVDRLGQILPDAKIFGVIRKQDDWIESIYKHDIQHFGVEESMNSFIKSDLGNDYLKSGDYFTIYKLLTQKFGSENVKLLLFEDLVRNPKSFAKELSDFLEVEFNVDSLNQKANKSLNNFTLYCLRFANKLANNDPSKIESKLYWLTRRFILNYTTRKLKIFKLKQLFNRQDFLVLDRFKKNNEMLASLINKEVEMKKYGYY